MNIGLIDVDGHNFPNLALMKIASYHKALGDDVEWVNYFSSYDFVYKSKIFTFSPDETTYIDAKLIITGGTGYGDFNTLPEEIDAMPPDYSIYPKTESVYGFLTRGCIGKCPWCIVPRKEGDIKPYADIEDILQGRKSAVLMDNNVLASDWGIKQIEKIIKLKVKVDFNQGLDSRLITPDVAVLLSKVKWIRFIRTSCDTLANMRFVKTALQNLNNAGVKNYRIFVYVLLQDLFDSYKITTWLKEIGCIPFAQPFRDFTPNQFIPQWQLDMAQWVNKKSNLMSCDFKEYRPRNNFICSEYFPIGERNLIKQQKSISAIKTPSLL